MDLNTDLIVTLSAIVVCAGLAFVGIRKRFTENQDIRPYRIPWMIIALFSIAVGFMFFVHLVNIFGFETGGRR